MSTKATVQQLNEELARKINEEALRNPMGSPYTGKFLLFVDGKIQDVADSLNDLMSRFQALGVQQERASWMEIGIDYDEPQDVWGLL